MLRYYYTIETDGKIWKCYDYFTSYVSEADSLDFLMQKVEIQFGVGLEPFKKWKKVNVANGITTYHAYIQADGLGFNIENRQGYWYLCRLLHCKEAYSKPFATYEDLRKGMKQDIGMTLPPFSRLEVSYREPSFTDYTIKSRGKHMTVEQWNRL